MAQALQARRYANGIIARHEPEIETLGCSTRRQSYEEDLVAGREPYPEPDTVYPKEAA